MSPLTSNLSLQTLAATILLIFSIAGKAGGFYTSVFSFGDSIADTGNLYTSSLDSDEKNHFHMFSPPYGETFFHRPTGRCSDGRLIIDFIAESFGLPFLPPYLAVKNTAIENFKWGVNFAVVGATALDNSFFEERGIHDPYTNNSLGTQLNWFKDMLPSFCHTYVGNFYNNTQMQIPTCKNCSDLLKSSLVVVGEIGGNDYNRPLFMKRKTEEVQSFVPLVVNTISSAINELINLGATNIMVPGNFPIGCVPAYLTIYQSWNEKDYDPLTGCLTWLNDFSQFHNQQLQQELYRIQERYPHTKIIYADYYTATMALYRSPNKFGFGNEALKSCCGVGGSYNYNPLAMCGSGSVSACDDPSSYVSWDGIHFTEAAYRRIAKALLKGLMDSQELPFSST